MFFTSLKIYKFLPFTLVVSFADMDLFQLGRAIGNLEYDKALFGNYQPFLGVVNYDLSDDLIKTRSKDMCRKATCSENLYFFVLNTSFSTEDGENWFLLAFSKAIMQVFYSFNSYGIVTTLNTFVVPKQELLDSRKRLDSVVLVPYSYKNLVKNVAQPILLENDKLVRRFCERGNSAQTTDNRIEERDEYNLTEIDC